MFGLEKGRLRGDLIAAFQSMKGASKQEGSGLFDGVAKVRPRGSGVELKMGCQVGFFFTDRVVRWWNRMPRAVVDAPSLEVFKARLDGALGSLLYYER